MGATYPEDLPNVPSVESGNNGQTTAVVETGIEGQDGEKQTIRPGARKN
jgi:hypothetical protein